jgi:hypothetical protein
MYRQEFNYFYLKLKEPLKNFKPCRVSPLGLDLFIFVDFLKTSPVTQSLYYQWREF